MEERLRRKPQPQPQPQPQPDPQSSPFPGLTPEDIDDNEGFPVGVDPNDYLKKSDFEREKAELLRRLQDGEFDLEKDLDETKSRIDELRAKLRGIVTDEDLRAALKSHAIGVVAEAVEQARTGETSFKEALLAEARLKAREIAATELSERLPKLSAAIDAGRQDEGGFSGGAFVTSLIPALLGGGTLAGVLIPILLTTLGRRIKTLEDKNDNNVPDVLEGLKAFELLSKLRGRLDDGKDR